MLYSMGNSQESHSVRWVMVGEFPIQPEQSLGFQPSLPEDFCATSATVVAGISFGCVVPFPFLHISTLEAHPTHRKWFIDVKSWRGLKLRNHQHRAGKHRCREPEVSRWATGPRACVITHLTVDTLRGDVVVSECFRMFQISYDDICDFMLLGFFDPTWLLSLGLKHVFSPSSNESMRSQL